MGVHVRMAQRTQTAASSRRPGARQQKFSAQHPRGDEECPTLLSKAFGCMLCEAEANGNKSPIDIAPFSTAIMSGRPHPEVFLKFGKCDGAIGRTLGRRADVPHSFRVGLAEVLAEPFSFWSKCWSEWQDLVDSHAPFNFGSAAHHVRDVGVAGSAQTDPNRGRCDRR
jgi:hypothetical protein